MTEDVEKVLRELRAERHKASELISQDKFIEKMEAEIAMWESQREALSTKILDTRARIGMLKKAVMAQEERLALERAVKNHDALSSDLILNQVAHVLEKEGGSCTASQLSLGLKRLYNVVLPASGISAKLLVKMDDDSRFQVVRRDTRNYLYQLKGYDNKKK